MLLAIDGSLREVGGAHAAHQDAARAEWRRRQRLALDHRRGERGCRQPCEMRSATASKSVSGDSSGWIKQVAVEAEDLVEQLLAEAVHHRHDDDERRDAEHDAEERKAGDDRDKSFLAPRAQIAQRQHPFEAEQRAACRSARSSLLPGSDFITILAVSSHRQIAPGLACTTQQFIHHVRPRDRSSRGHDLAAAVGTAS